MDATLRKTLIEMYNLSSLSEAEQNEIIERIGSLVFQAILMRVMENMSDTDKQSFEKLLDHDASPEEITGFLREKVPGFDEVAKEEAEKLHADSVNFMNKISS